MRGATTYTDVVLPVLREEYGRLRHATEFLARDAGATPRAAENWLAGLCAPTGEKLLNLMAACERVRVAVNEAAIERRQNLHRSARAAEQYVRERKGVGNGAGDDRMAGKEDR